LDSFDKLGRMNAVTTSERRMNCLTICQPYAHLIVTPQSELPVGEIQKRVENRSWHTMFRGPLLIHAGKADKYLRGTPWKAREKSLTFGAIIGIVDVVGCAVIHLMRQNTLIFELGQSADQIRVVTAEAEKAWPWLTTHPHAEGPYGFILANPRRFVTPVTYLGNQGFFKVDEYDERIRKAIETSEAV